MNYIENTYICLAAQVLLSIICLRKDARRLLGFFLAGMTACLCSAYISTYVTGLMGTDFVTASFEIVPIVEEVMKILPLVFYLLIFEPEKDRAVSSTLMIAVGFATFENVCFLTSYGTSNLLRLLIRGFGTGAMHVGCGVVVAAGLFILWGRAMPQMVGTFALLCCVITFHAIFNIFADQTGIIFWIGTAFPLLLMPACFLFFRRRGGPS